MTQMHEYQDWAWRNDCTVNILEEPNGEEMRAMGFPKFIDGDEEEEILTSQVKFRSRKRRYA